ncbi:exported hypothetical protein [Cupriavidus oxalaticus]|uniref:Uncharacterized protein n=1 Tax=Cupriavidus oxalaticus TaxID=96344 RepID=A0A375G852_9BURK|nr:exported hypothetical protein [Cupriavidus oxalaticus]
MAASKLRGQASVAAACGGVVAACGAIGASASHAAAIRALLGLRQEDMDFSGREGTMLHNKRPMLAI